MATLRFQKKSKMERKTRSNKKAGGGQVQTRSKNRTPVNNTDPKTVTKKHMQEVIQKTVNPSHWKERNKKYSSKKK